MARPPRTIEVAALTDDSLPPESEALLERAADGRRELDAQQIAARKIQRFIPAIQAAERIRTAHFYASITDNLIAQSFAEVRRSKSYVGMPRPGAPEGRPIETLEEYCRAYLGRSYDRCLELESNLHLLGPELYERAQEIGFRAKDYRALKALPADDQEALRDALAQTESRDELMDVFTALVARQQQAREIAERGRERAQNEADEAKANYKAASSILGEREAELRRLKGGELPPPMMDAQMADWGKWATECLSTALEWVEQLAKLLDVVAQTEPAGDSAAERDGQRRALALVDDACTPLLGQLEEKIGALVRAHALFISDKRWGLEEERQAGIEAVVAAAKAEEAGQGRTLQ